MITRISAQWITGYIRRLWDVEEHTANKVTFVIEDADGQQGYPGNAVMKVTYEVTEADELPLHIMQLRTKQLFLI